MGIRWCLFSQCRRATLYFTVPILTRVTVVEALGACPKLPVQPCLVLVCQDAAWLEERSGKSWWQRTEHSRQNSPSSSRPAEMGEGRSVGNLLQWPVLCPDGRAVVCVGCRMIGWSWLDDHGSLWILLACRPTNWAPRNSKCRSSRIGPENLSTHQYIHQYSSSTRCSPDL